MTGVRGRVVVLLVVGARKAAASSSVDGGNGRFAAQRMSMSPIHSDGPCLQSTAEDLFDTLEQVKVSQSLVARASEVVVESSSPCDKGQRKVDLVADPFHGRYDQLL